MLMTSACEASPKVAKPAPPMARKSAHEATNASSVARRKGGKVPG